MLDDAVTQRGRTLRMECSLQRACHPRIEHCIAAEAENSNPKRAGCTAGAFPWDGPGQIGPQVGAQGAGRGDATTHSNHRAKLLTHFRYNDAVHKIVVDDKETRLRWLIVPRGARYGRSISGASRLSSQTAMLGRQMPMR